jgi:hypothetical protein
VVLVVALREGDMARVRACIEVFEEANQRSKPLLLITSPG